MSEKRIGIIMHGIMDQCAGAAGASSAPASSASMKLLISSLLWNDRFVL